MLVGFSLIYQHVAFYWKRDCALNLLSENYKWIYFLYHILWKNSQLVFWKEAIGTTSLICKMLGILDWSIDMIVLVAESVWDFIYIYHCTKCDFPAYVRCIIGSNADIKIGSSYTDKNHQHLVTLVRKTESSPPGNAWCRPFYDLALECTQIKVREAGEWWLEKVKQMYV